MMNRLRLIFTKCVPVLEKWMTGVFVIFHTAIYLFGLYLIIRYTNEVLVYLGSDFQIGPVLTVFSFVLIAPLGVASIAEKIPCKFSK